MGRFKALICGVGHRRSSYQKFESNGEETRDYWCYKCSQCGHRGKAKPEELTLVVENVLQDSNLAAHDSAHSKLNNSKNLEPQQPKFKNNCLKMVNNNLTATTKCNQRIECHQPNLPIQDDDEENDDLEHGNDSQELMASPWYQQGLSRDITTEILSSRPVGSFVVRQSQSRTDAWALSVHIPYGIVAHYLIQKIRVENKIYYKIQDSRKIFHSLVSLVIHHSVMPESLPCPLVLSCDFGDFGSNPGFSNQKLWHSYPQPPTNNRDHDFADTDLADYSSLVMTLRKSISSSTSDISLTSSLPD